MDNDIFSSRIRLRHLQCFVTVAQEQHLRKAAEKLHLSQPAISKTLAELEELVGARLMERGRFGARLTRDGQAFLAHAVSVMDALESARLAVQAKDQAIHEAVFVGALPTVAPDLLPLAMGQFRTIYPNARIDIQVAANAPLLDRLRAGELDLVLGRMADPQMMVGLSFELLYVEPLIAVARPDHPLFEMGSVSLNDVIHYPLIVSTRGTVPRHNTESYLQAHGLKLPSNCVETLSVSVARLIAIQSDAVWIAPMGAARDDLSRQTLRQLPVASDGTEEPVGLVYRSDSGGLGAAAQALMRILREIAVSHRKAAQSWARSRSH